MHMSSMGDVDDESVEHPVAQPYSYRDFRSSSTVTKSVWLCMRIDPVEPETERIQIVAIIG